MVEISIVIPMRKRPVALLNDLKKQTYKNFEVVLGKGPSAPKALNYGIERAKGKKIIFVESDVRIFSRNWLSEMNRAMDKYGMVKADQAILQFPLPESYNNSGMPANIAKSTLFDEHYKVAEDVEWFQRLRSKGYEFKRIRKPVVWHFKKMNAKKEIIFSFKTGVTFSRIALSYKHPNMNFKRMFLSRAYNFGAAIIMTLGEIYGLIVFFPLIFKRKIDDVEKEGGEVNIHA
jgi:glycosyltransferase involved in cell wall biosynthesis